MNSQSLYETNRQKRSIMASEDQDILTKISQLAGKSPLPQSRLIAHSTNHNIIFQARSIDTRIHSRVLAQTLIGKHLTRNIQEPMRVEVWNR